MIDYMEEGASPLVGAFYAEFDLVRGPVVKHAFGPAQLSKTEFRAITPYVLPDRMLTERLLVFPVAVAGYAPPSAGGRVKLMGYSISVFDEWYKRNTFSFNVCFLVLEKEGLPLHGSSGADDGGGMNSFVRGRWQQSREQRFADVPSSTDQFEPALRKLNHALRDLEIQHHFLSSDTSRSAVGAVVRAAFEGLSSCGEAVGSHTLLLTRIDWIERLSFIHLISRHGAVAHAPWLESGA